MDFVNTSLFKYLQNHSLYKFYCNNEKLMNFINEDNRSKYKPYLVSHDASFDVYIEIVSESNNSFNDAIFVNIWKLDNNICVHYYSLNGDRYHKKIIYSKLFRKYPILSNIINYDDDTCHHFLYIFREKEIIKILEKFQILNPQYRNKQFHNITQKCAQTIIYIKNILWNDLVQIIINLLLELLPHGEDFIWHHKQKLKY
jgi:hypothetical protein